MFNPQRDEACGSGPSGFPLYWQCVGLCLQASVLGLKVIERHRLNRFIALHRTGGRVPKPMQHAAMRVFAVCRVRRRLLQMPASTKAARRQRSTSDLSPA